MTITKTRITRRHALRTAATATALPLVHIRTAGAAGKLAIGFWDHWVPQGNAVMKRQVETWASQNKVDVQADFITSVGNKLLMTQSAEAQAKTGHDCITFRDWEVQNHAEHLDPVDDLMKILQDRQGQANSVAAYLARIKGTWRGIPTTSGTCFKGPCARISVMKQAAGIDIQAMYPAEPRQTAEAGGWTYDAHLKAAEACHKIGMTFAIGLGITVDSVDTAGALFRAYDAELISEKGDITVRSDNVRRVMEHAQQLVRVLPVDAVSYDDASNNRALISGKSALIWNPPSAYAVAKRDAPKIAEDCWTFPAPSGPAGRFTPTGPYFWGIWQFSKNKTAAKELIAYLLDRPQVEERCIATEGFDVPPFANMTDFAVWGEVGPPKGTMFNYPVRPFHDNKPHIAGAPAPPEMAVQMFNRGTMPTMFAKLQRGESIPAVLAWAEEELTGFMR